MRMTFRKMCLVLLVVGNLNANSIIINLWGEDILAEYNEDNFIFKPYICDDFAFEYFKNNFSQINNEAFINDIQSIKYKYQLNDWYFIQYINILLDSIYKGGNITTREYTKWSILRDLNYNVGIILVKDSLNIVIAISSIKQRCYFTGQTFSVDKTLYALLKPYDKKTEFTILKSSFIRKGDMVGLSLNIPKIENDWSIVKDISGTLYGDSFKIVFNLDKNYLSFLDLNQYLNIDYLFKSSISKEIINDFSEGFNNLFRDKSDVDKLNYLLLFLRKYFKYETDREQFNQTEKFLMPEQLVYYGKGDCEDKAILLAFLVNLFTELKTVLIIGDTHVSVGINGDFNDKFGKYNFKYKGKKYWFIEPSTDNLSLPIGVSKFSNDNYVIID